MQVSFQNTIEDLREYNRLHRQTKEGRRQASALIALLMLVWAAVAAMCGLVVWLISSSWTDGLVFAGMTLVLAWLAFVIKAKLKPSSYALELITRQVPSLTLRQREYLSHPRTLSFDDDCLSLVTPFSKHSWSWMVVEQARHTAGFIHLTIADGSQLLVPRRAFPSEQAFADFWTGLSQLREAGISRSIEGPVGTNSA